MGKGRIVSEVGEGQYVVEIDEGSAEKGLRVAAINAKIADAQARKTAQQEGIDAYEVRLAELAAELDAAIDAVLIAPADEVDKAQKEVDQKTREVSTVRAALEQARTQLKLTDGEIANLQRALAALDAIEPVRQMPLWCADWTLQASVGADVATIEVPGEPVNVLIRAGARDGGMAYNAARDGRVLKRELMTPEQAFFNAALLPGVQRHKPTYRIGTLTAKDDDTNTGTVQLDDDRSSAQALPINARTVLQNCQIRYMTCNASAFKVGDRVLLTTVGNNWDSTAQVVGFASNPRPCMPTVWLGLDRQYWKERRGGQLVEGREWIILTEFVMGAGMTGDWTFPYSITLNVQGVDLGYIVADTGWVDESSWVVPLWPLYPVHGTYEIGRWWTVRGVFENTDDLGAISAWLATKLPPTLTVRHGERDYPYRFAGAEHIYTDPAREILPYYLPEWDLIE